jgi:hypothetical protein
VASPRPRVVFEDPDLPHQIVLRFTGGNSHLIAVSCNCMRQGRGAPVTIEARGKWEAAEALAVWRAHLEEIGEPAA